MTTFECMVLFLGAPAALRKGVWARGRVADGEGACGRKDAAATKGRPKAERRGGDEKRRKAEENRMKVEGGELLVVVFSGDEIGMRYLFQWAFDHEESKVLGWVA